MRPSSIKRWLAKRLDPRVETFERVHDRLLRLHSNLNYGFDAVRAVTAWSLAPDLETEPLRDVNSDLAVRLLHSAELEDALRLCDGDDWEQVEPTSVLLVRVADLRRRYESLLKITGFKN